MFYTLINDDVLLASISAAPSTDTDITLTLELEESVVLFEIGECAYLSLHHLHKVECGYADNDRCPVRKMLVTRHTSKNQCPVR